LWNKGGQWKHCYFLSLEKSKPIKKFQYLSFTMCRWLAYIGSPVLISDLIVTPKDNLIDQSLHARASRMPTNGDGFGIGWYDKQPLPGLFRSIRPAWNDLNLLDLASHIESNLFIAHVRATSLATVQETNCHPFRYKRWLFAHNGQIARFELLRQALMAQLAPVYFDNMLGSTDSELMFHLALTFGLEQDVPSAIREMVRVIEETGRAKGIAQSLWMTLAISDGETLWGFRYGSDGKGPSLYISPDIAQLERINPAIKGKFGDFAACLVSEPIGNYQDIWHPIPDNAMVIIGNQQITERSFGR
jgi:glutamine amidotransferase